MRLLLLVLLACKGDPVDTAADSSPPEVPERAADWCEGAQPGPPGGEAFALELARAHAWARYLAVEGEGPLMDAALSVAVNADWDEARLDTYAELGGHDQLCAVHEAAPTLGAASLSVDGSTATLIVGTGSVTIPAEVDTVVVDVSALPAGPEADATLRALLGGLITEDLELGTLRARSFSGLPIQWSDSGVYDARLGQHEDTLIATGERAPRLIFRTGVRTSPEATRLILGLRLDDRAELIGADLFGAVAESTWLPVGESALFVRTVGAQDSHGVRLPERLYADAPDLETLLVSGSGEARVEDASRETLQAYAAEDYQPTQYDTELAWRRTMLMTAWGTLDLFFPYFEEVGRGIDDALLAELDAVEALSDDDRLGLLHALGRLLHASEDGHAFFGDLLGGGNGDTLDLDVSPLGGRPLVRHSGYAEVSVGSLIVEVDGEPVEDWLAEAMTRYSAASEGYLFDLACRELLDGQIDRALTFEDAEGARSTPTLTPIPTSAHVSPFGGSLREAGPLDDLGAPELYYINLSQYVMTDEQPVYDAAALWTQGGVEGLVLDMRSYPGHDFYTTVRYLVPEAFSSPIFRIPRLDGLGPLDWAESSYSFTPVDEAFTGPIVLLVSNKSVSAAENLSQMLLQNPQLTVVGQDSAATNGNITGAYLPGGYYQMFTGMKVLNPDGSRFHGVGIQVDVEVTPTQAELAAGVDPELEAAVAVLSAD